MNAQTKKSANLKLVNECTIYEASQLHKKLFEILQKTDDITLDLSTVERMDASFLQLLIAAQTEAKQCSADLKVNNSDLVNELASNLYCQSEIGCDVAVPNEEANGNES